MGAEPCQAAMCSEVRESLSFWSTLDPDATHFLTPATSPPLTASWIAPFSGRSGFGGSGLEAGGGRGSAPIILRESLEQLIYKITKVLRRGQ